MLKWKNSVRGGTLLAATGLAAALLVMSAGPSSAGLFSWLKGNPNQGGAYSDVRSWSEFRTPDLMTMNLMISYDFFHVLKQHLSANVQVTNVLALSTTSGVSATEGTPNGTQFGLASTRQDFRAVTLGVRYEF